MRPMWTPIALASCLTLAAADAHAECAPDGDRVEATLAPTLTLELRAERLRDRVARGRGLEVTVWATWDVSRLWRTRPHLVCTPPPSFTDGVTP